MADQVTGRDHIHASPNGLYAAPTNDPMPVPVRTSSSEQDHAKWRLEVAASGNTSTHSTGHGHASDTPWLSSDAHLHGLKRSDVIRGPRGPGGMLPSAAFIDDDTPDQHKDTL
jgi:hypothetical protein